MIPKSIFVAATLLLFHSAVCRAAEPSSPDDALVVERPAFFADVKVDRPDGRYRAGDTMSVAFQTEKEAHAYLLYHQADGSCLMLFPNQAHPDNKLQAGEKIALPDPKLKYRFRVKAPFGEESLQVVASAAPIAELAALDISKGQAAPVSPEILKTLAERMKADGGKLAEHRVKLHSEPGDAPLRERRPAKRAALCFGPSKYARSDIINAFPRYKNAPVQMGELFVNHGGVAAENARVLVDENASRENFKQSVTEWLPSITEPGDTVFIFFHGHGGPIENLDGSEDDGHDEYLTTYDTDPEAVEGDYVASIHKTSVVDDALARWLQELPGRQIVLLVDTCYGGGLVDAKRTGGFCADEAKRVGDVTGLNTVVLSAGLADEVTFSTYDNSFLTMAFAEAATELPRPLTVRQAFAHFKTYLTKIQSKETPDEAFELDHYAQEPVLTDEALLEINLFE